MNVGCEHGDAIKKEEQDIPPPFLRPGRWSTAAKLQIMRIVIVDMMNVGVMGTTSPLYSTQFNSASDNNNNHNNKNVGQ